MGHIGLLGAPLCFSADDSAQGRPGPDLSPPFSSPKGAVTVGGRVESAEDRILSAALVRGHDPGAGRRRGEGGSALLLKLSFWSSFAPSRQGMMESRMVPWLLALSFAEMLAGERQPGRAVSAGLGLPVGACALTWGPAPPAPMQRVLSHESFPAVAWMLWQGKGGFQESRDMSGNGPDQP